MRTTGKGMRVENRARSECAASAKIPRLPDNRPTRSLRAAKLPLATIEAVVTACLESVPGSFPTSLFESHGWRIPSSGFEFVACMIHKSLEMAHTKVTKVRRRSQWKYESCNNL